MKTAFIGHRKIFANGLEQRLTAAVEEQIESGCKTFMMGAHGDFDALALKTCRQLRRVYPDIEIEVVITSLNAPKNKDYSDVKTVLFDIEEIHFKRRITLSNRKMLGVCGTLICYVDDSVEQSGAKSALKYAEKTDIKIVNLYREDDNPFYGMTKREIDAYMNEAYSKLNTAGTGPEAQKKPQH